MRIRSIKPEFWRSDDVSRLERDDRLLFIGLWSYVDDNGVGRDRLAEVCADLFAHDLERDPRDTFARVSRGLAHLAAAGLIYRYTVDGRDLIEVVTWSDHQRIDRPAKARLPRYDSDRDTLARDSRHPREDAATGAGEQGNRGTGEQGAEEQASSSEVAVATPRPDVDRLLDLLDAEIVRNGGRKPTRSKKNVDAMRLMLDRDERSPEQVERAIRWCQSDEFWRSNILSASKLREQYEKLRLQAARSQGRGSRPSAAERGLTLVQELEEQEREQHGREQEAIGA